MPRAPFADRSYVCFPPRGRLLMLPRRPLRAARSGLALYEAVEPAQRAGLAAMRALLPARLDALLPHPQSVRVDWDWWERWIAEVAEPVVGRIEHIAVRVPATARVCMLLMDRDGRPVGFAKVLDNPEPALSSAALRVLAEAGTRAFRVPTVLSEGVFAGVRYHLSEALPEGTHRRPPFDPDRVRAVIDEFTAHLAALPRPDVMPQHHVMCHTGFTPRNMRVARDGSWWLFDLDNVRWGPRLASELRYWTAEFSYRFRPRVDRIAPRVLSLLRERGSSAEIREAVHWPDQTHTFRPIERAIHLRVAELAA